MAVTCSSVSLRVRDRTADAFWSKVLVRAERVHSGECSAHVTRLERLPRIIDQETCCARFGDRATMVLMGNGERRERTRNSTAAAREAHCWFAVDRVAGDRASTAWKRAARLHQARWRLANDYPIGAQPYAGGPDATPVGSRLNLRFAREIGANLLTAGAKLAARRRLEAPEPHQTLLETRLWADLLSSMPLCFNLFGELATDPVSAAKSVAAWWPDVPRGVVQVRFEHSPGRRDTAFLGNRSAFDVAFEIAAGDALAVIGVEVKYHEHAVAELVPRAAALARYIEVSERSGVFRPSWRAELVGTDLQQIWLDHLLLLSMLQHPSRRWSSGRFVLAYPKRNTSYDAAARRYQAVLRDSATFEARTLEELVSLYGGPQTTIALLRERYLAVSLDE